MTTSTPAPARDNVQEAATMPTLTIDRAAQLLADGRARTPAQIAEDLGVWMSTALRVCRTLHAEGRIHIAGWVYLQDGGRPSQLFRLGAGKDAPRRPAAKSAERQRECRARQAAAKAAQANPRLRDPLTAALFGECRTLSIPQGPSGRVHRLADDEREAA